jgi:hypothetical protein
MEERTVILWLSMNISNGSFFDTDKKIQLDLEAAQANYKKSL